MEQEAQSMKGYHFYAMLSRMKYINRWGLMRNTREENICEHSLEVAMIAHSLAVLKNQRFGGRVNPERAALLGMFHDAAEIITGDLPTPVKYFNSEIRAAYQEVENMAKDRLLSMLPEALRQFSDYRMLVYAIVLILVMLATNNPTLKGFFSRLFHRERADAPHAAAVKGGGKQ